MIFEIDRASGKYNECPCKGAYKVYTEENDFTWKINISSLDELMKLISELRSGLIIGTDNDITIYDSYVE